MATLKEFEEALREHGMHMALALLERLREREPADPHHPPGPPPHGPEDDARTRRQIQELHAATGMTQQEIAFKVGVNQGRVNEVLKRGKWLDDDPHAPEAVARDRAKARMRADPKPRPTRVIGKSAGKTAAKSGANQGQRRLRASRRRRGSSPSGTCKRWPIRLPSGAAG